MLQKKRDEFRKQIRRNQLEKFFEQKRKLLLQHMLNSDIFNQINQIWKQIQSCLHSIAQKNYILAKQTMEDKMQQKELKIEHKQDQQNFYTLVSHFHKLKSIAPYQFQQIFTEYMMNKQSAQKVLIILNDVIENEWDLQEQRNQWLHDSQAKKYPTVVRVKVTSEIIKFIDTLGLIVIGPDIAKAVIDSIWKLMTDASNILLKEIQNYELFKYTLSILTKLLEDNKNPSNYQYMQQKGLGGQIVKFIDHIRKLPVPLEIHSGILHLADNYLNSEINFSHSSGLQKIGEVTIQTSKVNQKEMLLAYCIAFIDKSQESLYSIVFACISKILEIHQFLVDNLKQEYWQKITNLILHKNRDIQIQALTLLNDFTYHSQSVLDFLLEKTQLFDILYKRLMIEKQTNDHSVTPCMEKIAYIICNSLLTDKVKIKKACLNHHLWEEVSNSLYPTNKLFPLIMTMPYFISARGHKNFDKFFRPYLETLKNFNWQQCRYAKSIKDSIMNTFYNSSQQWQEHEYMLFLNILQQEGFLYMVEQFVDQSDLNKIKDIEIQ